LSLTQRLGKMGRFQIGSNKKRRCLTHTIHNTNGQRLDKWYLLKIICNLPVHFNVLRGDFKAFSLILMISQKVQFTTGHGAHRDN
jgi:hypothetical protein